MASGPIDLPAGYSIHEGYPSVLEYLHIRSAAGLSPKTPAQAAKVATGSWYGCYVQYTPEDPIAPCEIVGMGRCIGDGGWYFHIADMGVLPEHQRKGLGDAILKNILAYIEANAAEGRPYVNLFADPLGRRLYARNGFEESAPKETGMMLRIKDEAETALCRRIVAGQALQPGLISRVHQHR